MVSRCSYALSWFLFQDVLLICCTPDWISQNHVLPSCRMVLRSQNVLGLNRAPCLAVFLERLPLLLQEQYSYERVFAETYPLKLFPQNILETSYWCCYSRMFQFVSTYVCVLVSFRQCRPMWQLVTSSSTVPSCRVWPLWQLVWP